MDPRTQKMLDYINNYSNPTSMNIHSIKFLLKHRLCEDIVDKIANLLVSELDFRKRIMFGLTRALPRKISYKYPAVVKFICRSNSYLGWYYSDYIDSVYTELNGPNFGSFY